MKNNWPTKKLGEVAEFVNGYVFKSSSWMTDGLPIIRIQNLNDPDKEFNHFIGQIDSKYHIANGDILVSWSGSIGVYKWDRGPALLNQHIFKIGHVSNEVGIEYLFLVLQTKIDEIKTKLHGGTMKHVTKFLFDNISINLPPIEQQKKIVERLDSIRKAQELCDIQVQKVEELFNNLIRTEVLEAGFQKVKLMDVSKQQEFVDPRANPELGYQYIDISSIDSENLSIDKNKIKEFKGKDAPSRARKVIIEGDILFSTVRPNLKRMARIDYPVFNSLASTGFAVLRPDESKINPSYMGTVTCSGIVTEQVLPYVRGAAFPAVSDSQIFESEIPLPSRKEQDRISEKLNAIQNYKKILFTQKSLLKELFDSVLHKSMNGEMDG